MSLFSRSKKKKHDRGAAYARPRWVDMARLNVKDQPGTLNVDFEKLAADGFITNGTIEDSLGREFSLIKRRLFRRLDYFVNSKKGQRANRDERCPVVLVTSSKPGEGKTFSSSNLALSLAVEEQIKVLLMDTDLAKPSIPGVFGFPEDKVGLFDCLTDTSRNVRNDIETVAGMNLSILPAGQATSSPAHLLGGEPMLRVLDDLSFGENAFDFIVMDGPPLLATTEASVLATYADEIVLVVGAGDSTTTQVKSSLDMLGGHEKINLMINLMPLGEPLPTEYGYINHAA